MVSVTDAHRRRQEILDDGILDQWGDEGVTLTSLAAKYGMSIATVRSILQDGGVYKVQEHHRYAGCTPDERDAYMCTDDRLEDLGRRDAVNRWLRVAWATRNERKHDEND